MGGPKHNDDAWKAKWSTTTIAIELPKNRTKDFEFGIKLDPRGKVVQVTKPDGTAANEIDGHDGGGGTVCSNGTCHVVIGTTHYCVKC